LLQLLFPSSLPVLSQLLSLKIDSLFLLFMITAITAGQLSARARQRSEEAETARQEIERLLS